MLFPLLLLLNICSHRLALLLGTYLKSYLPYFDNPQAAVDSTGTVPALQHEAVVVEALVYMVRISAVEDEDIFKTCLEFWVHFTKELYSAEVSWKSASSGSGMLSSGGSAYGSTADMMGMGGSGGGIGGADGNGMGGTSPFPNIHSMSMNSNNSNNNISAAHLGRAKHLIFEPVLHQLRVIMIDHMAKPEEVIIVEDDNGEIVREMTKDTEVKGNVC